MGMDVKAFGNSLRYFTCLEYLGIHIVSIKRVKVPCELSGDMKTDMVNAYIEKLIGTPEKVQYKFSIPAKSELVLTDETMKEIIEDKPYNTTEGLISILTDVVRDKMVSALITDEDRMMGDDFEDYFKEHIKEKISILVRERNEIWNNEKADKAVRDMLKQMNIIYND